ncbi:centromere protein x [Anaeramoeba flamelloides]|uniref:Centromere protein x n=1 Tax=Anaeramoeba flamelloides TaxID=1746091 RepID=A0AAV7ZA14_9EUKA|nr:centromere protein x [Anaeramoeba flamelloides]KAJ6244202.1 centromere protein x [Anaeramoeba flamelloides]
MNFDQDSEKKTTFSELTIEAILKDNFQNKKTRIPKETLSLVTEYLRIITEEGAKRIISIAKTEESSQVDVCHIEQYLPQFLLDI